MKERDSFCQEGNELPSSSWYFCINASANTHSPYGLYSLQTIPSFSHWRFVTLWYFPMHRHLCLIPSWAGYFPDGSTEKEVIKRFRSGREERNGYSTSTLSGTRDEFPSRSATHSNEIQFFTPFASTFQHALSKLRRHTSWRNYRVSRETHWHIDRARRTVKKVHYFSSGTWNTGRSDFSTLTTFGWLCPLWNVVQQR